MKYGFCLQSDHIMQLLFCIIAVIIIYRFYFIFGFMNLIIGVTWIKFTRVAFLNDLSAVRVSLDIVIF